MRLLAGFTRMRALGAGIIGLIAMAATAAETKPGPAAVVAYRLTPEVRNGAVTALDVEIRLRADATGRTLLDLPDRGMGQKDRWRFISNLHVDGASVSEDGPAKRILSSKPGAPIAISYRVHSAYASDPTGADANPYKGAVIRPTWFSSLGGFVFITPERRDNAPATFRWGPLPKGWAVGSDLDPVTAGRPMTVASVVDSTLLGGADVKLYARPIPGGVLRVATRGGWTFPERRLIDDIATVVGAQRAFWGGASGPYFVSVMPLAVPPYYTSLGGTARFEGFALYGTSNAEEAEFRRLLAHEHTHNWIPFQQGDLPEGAAQPGAYWYSEGFTDFYADRTQLRTALWTPRDFIAHLNEVLRDYDISPAQRAPNSRIVADFWKNPDVSALAYQRGYLLAFIWDGEIRRATHDSADLDQVMFAMRDRYLAAPAKAKPGVIANFETTARDLTGVDVRPDVQRFAIQGDAISLPRDLFGACATIAAVTVPAFDLGFDAPGSAASGVFAGVDPSGPAYAAGLRNGMKRIAREGGEPGDSRVEIIYRVLDQSGVERTIRYQPQGRTNVTFQQATLRPEAAKRSASCAALLSGAVPRPRPITR